MNVVQHRADDPEIIALAARASDAGFTSAEIARLLGIGETTLRTWCVDHAALRAAIRVGKDGADDRVEAALYQRAVGFEREIEKVLVVDGAAQRVTVSEYYPPDVGAASKWLHNRRPQIWRRDGGVNVAVGVGVQVGAAEGAPTQADLARMSVDELQREYNAALSRISLE